MRLALLAALAASMVVPAAACTFDAYSVDQIRTLEIDLIAYKDGERFDSFAFRQDFDVIYDAILNTRAGQVATLKLRPRDMDVEPPVFWNAGPIKVEASATAIDIPPWIQPRPDMFGFHIRVHVDDDTPLEYFQEPWAYGGSTSQLGFPFRDVELENFQQTATGWTIDSRGPFDNTTMFGAIAAKIGDSRYDITIGNSRWTEATVPLTAPDCLCSGDHNADGRVDQSDIDLVLLNWGTMPPPEWTHDPPEFIRQSSLDSVLIGWGDVSPPKPMAIGTVPEPSALILIAIASCCIGRRR